MKECGERGLSARISFDLSHIGLSIDPELAYQNLMEMAKVAQSQGLSLMISMEESAKTDQILAIYKTVAGFNDQSHFSNYFKKQIGLTPKQYMRIFEPVTESHLPDDREDY